MRSETILDNRALRNPASASRIALALLGGVFLATTAQAGEDEPIFTLSGFGTVGAVYHDRAGVEYRRDMSQKTAAGSGQVSFAPDSMLAVQLTARPSRHLEAAVQLVSRNSLVGNYRPQTTWAYVKFKPDEALSLRAGRLGGDMYLQGDSSEIGYANLSIRQPHLFYPRTFDGIDAEFVQPAGPGMFRFKAMAGHTVGWLATNDGVPYHHTGAKMQGGLAEYGWGGWTARFTAAHITLKNEADESLHQALAAATAMIPNGGEILDILSMRKRPLNHAAIDLGYDSGPWRSSLGLFQLTSPKWEDEHGLYARLGYRQGSFTPYVGYYLKHTNRRVVPTGIPWGLSAGTDALNQALETAQGAIKHNQSDIILGVRHEISRNAAVKLQAERIRYLDPYDIHDPGQLSERYDSRKPRVLPLFSAALEFVF